MIILPLVLPKIFCKSCPVKEMCSSNVKLRALPNSSPNSSRFAGTSTYITPCPNFLAVNLVNVVFHVHYRRHGKMNDF